MKKLTTLALVAVLVLSMAVAGCIGGGSKTSTGTSSGGSTYTGTSSGGSTYTGTITIYTGGTSGVYYPLGSKYAELLNKAGIKAKAVTSGASVSNAKAIGDGNAQAAIMQNDVAYYAYNGLYMFKGNPIKKLRGVAALYPETVQFVVRADSDIKSLQDLAGKKVAIGAPGSGTAVAAEQILKAAGVWDKIQKVNQKFSQAAQALKLGQIDAAVIVSGAPTPAITQIAVTTPVRVLPIPDDVLNKLKSEGYIFYVRQVLPKDTYKGMTEDTPTLAVKAILVVSSDLPDDVVYEMTKVLFDNVDQLRAVHQKAKYISLDTALDGMSIPLHPGAYKYYKEKGLSVSDNIKPPSG
jgi:TRAP transporter TAXI family solute receptor